MGVIKQGQAVLWLQRDGPGTPLIPYAAGDGGAAVTGKTIPVSSVAPVWGRNTFGAPVVISIDETPPGELPSVTIAVYERSSLNILERMLKRRCPLNAQIRFVECGTLDDPLAWNKLTHLDRGILTAYNPGDGPSLEFNNTIMQAAGTLSFRGYSIIVENGLDSLTSGAVEDILAIDGIPDDFCEDCGYGFPGADNFLVLGEAAATGVEAIARFSVNGGGAWTPFTNDPFGTIDENIDFVQVRPLGVERARVIFGTGTVAAGAKAHISWGDITWGDEAATTFTEAFIAGTANGNVVTALGWVLPRYVLAAAAGDIYKSPDQGKTFPNAAVYTGATAINGFAASPDGVRVWAYGASNLLLVERNQNDTFAARVGPAGGGAFTAFVEAADGTIYAGNGTALYKSTNQARNAGGWTSLIDFGAGKAIKKIQLIGGSSQLLRVVVDDTGGGNGAVYESVDGGASFDLVTLLTNTGYNGAYASTTDDNRVVIVGDGGVVHQLSPVD